MFSQDKLELKKINANKILYRSSTANDRYFFKSGRVHRVTKKKSKNYFQSPRSVIEELEKIASSPYVAGNISNSNKKLDKKK